MRVPGAERIYVKLKDLHPNPFRHIERYAIRPGKVEAIARSIAQNEWWENIEVRPRQKGGYEMAYGHHRHAALRTLYKLDDEVRVMVRELTDAQMLRRMADENLEFAGADALVDIETVGAVIEAYAAGLIDLEVERGTHRLPPQQGGKEYSLWAVARFLGWIKDAKNFMATKRCVVAFRAWHALRDHVLRYPELNRLADEEGAVSLAAVEAAIIAAERIRREADIEARTIETAARDASPAQQAHAAKRAKRIRTKGHRHARKEAARSVERIVRRRTTPTQEIARARREAAAKRQKQVIPIEEWVRRVVRDLKQIAKTDSFENDLLSILKNADALEDAQLATVADALREAAEAVSRRWRGYEGKLREVIRKERIKLALPAKGE